MKHGWFLRGSKPSCPVNWSRGKQCVFGALDFENGGKLISKQAKKINSKTCPKCGSEMEEAADWPDDWLVCLNCLHAEKKDT